MLSRFIEFYSNRLIATTLVVIICLFPILMFGMTHGHDSNLHMLWSHYFSQQLFSGDLYPRWLVEMNSGFGSPVFYFYPPAVYYINSVIALFVDSSNYAHYIVSISIFFSFIISGIGMYLWSASHVSKAHAFLASIAYIILPYHVLIDVYYRATLAELWGIAIVPYLFFAASRISLDRKYQFTYVSIVSISALLLAHAPTALISIPFYCLYVMYITITRDKINWVKNFFFLAVVIIAAFSLSSFYVFPALTIDMPSMNVMWERYSYDKSFLYIKPIEGWFGFRTLLYGSSFVTAAFGLFLLVIYFIKKKMVNSEGFIIFLLLVASILMTTIISKPIWDNIGLIQKIQFPWRFNILVALFTAYAVGLGLSSKSLRPSFQKYNVLIYTFLISCMFLHLASGAYSLTHLYSDTEYKKLFSERADASEYQLSKIIFTSPQMEKISTDGIVTTIQKWSADKIHFNGEFKVNTKFVLKYLYFGDWNVFIDGKLDESVAVFKNSNGLMEFKIKNHANEIALYRIENKQVKIGFYITIFGLILLILMMLTGYIKHLQTTGKL